MTRDAVLRALLKSDPPLGNGANVLKIIGEAQFQPAAVKPKEV